MQLFGLLLTLVSIFATMTYGFSIGSIHRPSPPSCLTYPAALSSNRHYKVATSSVLNARLSDKRKQELGVADDEDEYDLGQALNANTDPFITQLLAGSFILVILGLLTFAVIIPLSSDAGDGLCNPIMNGGRC
jgi:hypothetical protein